MGVLFKELSVLYGAFVRGEADPLPELGVQYADYAVWQRKWMEGEILRRQAEYWKKHVGRSAGAAGVTGGSCTTCGAGLCGSIRRIGVG